MNEVLHQLAARKSVRVYTDEPVTAEERKAILQAAFDAPTAGCQQLYTIIDVTDRALKERLADLCDHQPFIAAAPLVLVFLADCRRWNQCYRAAGLEPRAPGPGDLLLAVADACIAAQNAVTAAESLGIGSCYIGDVIEQCESMRQALALPPAVVPAAMVVPCPPPWCPPPWWCSAAPPTSRRPGASPPACPRSMWCARTPTPTAPPKSTGPPSPPGPPRTKSPPSTSTPGCVPSPPASTRAVFPGK